MCFGANETTFEEVLRKHHFSPIQALHPDDDCWILGNHPTIGEGISVQISPAETDEGLEQCFDVCFNAQEEDDILEWVEKHNFQHPGFEKIATDGAYGAVWDIYGILPENLDTILDKVEKLYDFERQR